MKISVITVCKNAETSLSKTIESVFSQTYRDMEYLVVDGASTDNTVAIIKEHAQRYSIKWTSESDSGIYQAMNKGVARATGEILFFLNSGDTFADKTVLSRIADEFEKKEVELLYGNVIFTDDTGRSRVKRFDRVDRFFLFQETINHQSMFYAASIFKRIGGFHENYRIVADYEHLCRMFAARITARYLDMNICIYPMGGVSSKQENLALYHSERMRVREQYFTRLETTLYSNRFYREARRLLRKSGVGIYG